MRRHLPKAVIGLFVAAGLAAPALGGQGGPDLEVALADDRIGVSDREVRPGRVTIRARNAGTTEHELLVVRTDLAPDRIPLGLEGPAVKLAGDVVLGRPHTHEQHGARTATDHLRPGRSRLYDVELTPGDYVLLCTLPGHYAAGQRAALRVAP